MIDLPFKKKEEKQENSCEEIEESHEKCKSKLNLLKLIIERYREQIEMGETKTIPDLRNLVDPNNKAIQQVKETITNDFHPYIYEKDFQSAADKAFSFLKEEIGDEALPVDFWLLPEEVLELKVADEMDKAIFLCSLLIALDNETAKVVVETNGERHALVLYEFNGTYHLMDPVHDLRISGTKEEILEKVKRGDSRPSYEFNNKGYEEW